MDYVIDAKNQKPGRIATQVAHILQGKQNPSYEPREAGSDKVIVKNASKMVVTGRKAEQKIYHRHTGYVGHLKKRSYKEQFASSPGEVLKLAVRRMLPKNFLNQKRMNRLVVEK